MTERIAGLMQELEHIRSRTFSDVAALAWTENPGTRMRWVCGCGHLNDRYKQMIVKPGIGVAGTVIRLGRPFKLDDTVSDAERIRAECPLMLAEKLRCAIAFPLPTGDHLIRGVLLIGKRTDFIYEEADIIQAKNTISGLKQLLEEQNPLIK